MAFRTRIKAPISVALACWLATGCSHYKPLDLRQPATPEETGSVHVAVLSTVPFEAVRAEFKPGFALKSEDALAEALVITQSSQTSINRTQQFLLSAAAPGADAPAASASAPASPSAPTPKAPDALGAAGTAPAVAGVSQHNAMLRYQLATALKQEVAMLNNYVSDAQSRAGYAPFIVRLQVNVRPLARATPFDVLSEIRFHAENSGDPAPIVVPLLAVDNEDASAVSSLERNVTQLGLALSVLKGAYGLGAALGVNGEDIVNSLGWQYQNISNLARIDDQTISLRVNAQPTGVKRFEMASRVHYVTVLMLAKRPERAAELARWQGEDRPHVAFGFQASTRFVHAVTGKGPQSIDGLTAADPPPQRGRFELAFWPDAVLPPDGQTAPLVVKGKKPPYTAELKLRGGDNLTTHAVQRGWVKTGGASPKRIDATAVQPSKDGTSRDTLVLRFEDLSKATVDALAGASPALKVFLALGPEGRRSGPGSREGIYAIEVVPDLTGLEDPAPPAAKAQVRTDRRLTVDPNGSAWLQVAVSFPGGDDAGKVKRVDIEFDDVVPAALRWPAGQPAGVCAEIAKGKLRVRRDCSVSVRLSNLPLTPYAVLSPAALRVTASEYADEAKAPSADIEVPTVALQFDMSRPCRDCIRR